MKQFKSIKLSITAIVCFLSFNAYSQLGFIEMKNGDLIEVADDRFFVEKGQLKYWKEKVDRSRVSVFGIMSKEKKAEYLSMIGEVNVDDVKIIHMQGKLSVGNKFVDNFIGIRFVKEGRYYQKYYVIVDGPCNLLIKSEDGNAEFSYYAKKANEEPYMLHLYGVGLGPKLKSRSKKYFKECAPAMAYIKSDLKLKTTSELIKIYNAECAR